MGVRLTISGADKVVLRLQEFAEKASQPLRPLFESIAEEWRSAFQEVIRSQRGFAPLTPFTVRQRKAEGFGPTPILIRTRDLLDSIGTLQMAETGFAVGTAHKGAALLHFGGKTSPESAVPNRPVPPRPFILLDAVVIDDTVEMLKAYLFGEEVPAGA